MVSFVNASARDVTFLTWMDSTFLSATTTVFVCVLKSRHRVQSTFLQVTFVIPVLIKMPKDQHYLDKKTTYDHFLKGVL